MRLNRLIGYLLENFPQRKILEGSVSGRPFNITLSDLVAHRDALFDAYEHCVYRDRCSKSSGPLNVVETGDGKYQLIDGYHRLIEHLLDKGGSEPISVIVGGAGSGEYAIAEEGIVGRAMHLFVMVILKT